MRLPSEVELFYAARHSMGLTPEPVRRVGKDPLLAAPYGRRRSPFRRWLRQRWVLIRRCLNV